MEDSQTQQKSFDDLVDTRVFLQRLQLERSLLVALRKLCVFLIVFICFANGLSTYQPVDEIGRVQRHIATYFNLDARKNVTSLGGLHLFMEAFANKTLALQPESGMYWCDRLYFRRSWNVTLNAPVTRCSSPNLDSVIVGGGERKVFDRVRKFPGPQISLSPAVAFQTRWRKKECTGFAKNYNDLAWKVAVGNTSVYSSHAGMIDSGSTIAVRSMTLQEAKVTCITLVGCTGFTFQGFVTSDAVGVFFKTGSFNTTPGNWSSFKLESVISPLRGERLDEALPCADRSKHTDEEFSHRMTCTVGDCKTTLFSRRQKFRDVDVFPEILWRSGKDSMRLRQINWLDSFTETLTVSAIVYTEGAQIFTFSEIKFIVDFAGGLSSEVRMRSYKDKDSVNSSHYLGCLISAFVLVAIESLFSIFDCYRNSRKAGSSVAPRRNAILEFVIFLALLIFILVLLVTWGNQNSDDASQYKPLQALVAATSVDAPAREELIKQFFVAADQICDRTRFFFQARITSYVILNLMLAQFVIYLRRHPKMQSVVDIVVCSFGDVIHLFMLFVPLFLMSAALAHWAFGPYLEDFQSYSIALSTQVRRFYGEALIDAGVEERLPSQRLVMYWTYTLTMWLVFFWMFIYLFAAILIGQRRPQVTNSNVANSFLWDAIDCVRAPLLSKMRGWPDQGLLIDTLIMGGTANGVLAVGAIANLEPFRRTTASDAIERLITIYNWKCKGRLIVGNTLSDGHSQLQAFAIPPAPKPELAADPPKITTEPTDWKAQLPLEIPFLGMGAQHALYAQVKQLVESRLKEALLHRTETDWESLASELAVAAVDKAQQVVIRATDGPDTAEFVVPLNVQRQPELEVKLHTTEFVVPLNVQHQSELEATPPINSSLSSLRAMLRCPQAMPPLNPSRLQTPKSQAPLLLFEEVEEEASQFTGLPGALDGALDSPNASDADEAAEASSEAEEDV